MYIQVARASRTQKCIDLKKNTKTKKENVSCKKNLYTGRPRLADPKMVLRNRAGVYICFVYIHVPFF